MGNRIYKRKEDNRVSTETRQILYKEGFHVQYRTKNKYRYMQHQEKKESGKSKPVPVNLDYAAVQKLGIVRHFIQAKYDLHIQELELLLFLYPLGLWSKYDYDKFPHRYTTRTLTKFVNLGFIEGFLKNKDIDHKKQVYKLSPKAKAIVKSFYEHLYMDKPIPEEMRNNPLFHPKVSPAKQNKARAIAKLNEEIRGDGKKTLARERIDKRLKKRIYKKPQEVWDEQAAVRDELKKTKKMKNYIEEIKKRK